MLWYHKEIENPGMLGGILNHPQPGVHHPVIRNGTVMNF